MFHRWYGLKRPEKNSPTIRDPGEDHRDPQYCREADFLQPPFHESFYTIHLISNFVSGPGTDAPFLFLSSGN
jgi:hypothetical protein